MPTFSVCLPSFNSVRFLSERIRSLQNQTESDFEVIVVDSHSGDGTWESLQAWAKMDHRVRLFQAPRGLYACWNRCIQESRGKWIYFATSDDTMTPDCLATLHAAAERHKEAQIVTSLPWVIDDCGATIAQPWDWRGRWLLGRPYKTDSWLSTDQELYWGLIIGTPTLSITQMLIRQDVFKTVGLFPENCGWYGDYRWQMLALRKVRWFHVGRQIGSWRKHDAQATPSEASKYISARAMLSLKLFEEGVLGSSHGVQYALGYCIGISDLEIPDTLPEGVRTWALAVRARPRGLLANQNWALLRARWLIGESN